MIFFIIVGLLLWGLEPHIPIVLASIVAALVATRIGYSWEAIISGILDSIGRATEALLIVMVVGMLIGSWVLAGTMPAMVYHGLSLLTPAMFLSVGAILCAIVGLATGSSWTASGTVGVALMGIAMGLGINPALAAGMVISGAYMGDKWSPLSDSTQNKTLADLLFLWLRSRTGGKNIPSLFLKYSAIYFVSQNISGLRRQNQERKNGGNFGNNNVLE